MCFLKVITIPAKKELFTISVYNNFDFWLLIFNLYSLDEYSKKKYINIFKTTLQRKKLILKSIIYHLKIVASNGRYPETGTSRTWWRHDADGISIAAIKYIYLVIDMYKSNAITYQYGNNFRPIMPVSMLTYVVSTKQVQQE